MYISYSRVQYIACPILYISYILQYSRVQHDARLQYSRVQYIAWLQYSRVQYIAWLQYSRVQYIACPIVQVVYLSLHDLDASYTI